MDARSDSLLKRSELGRENGFVNRWLPEASCMLMRALAFTCELPLKSSGERSTAIPVYKSTHL
jgi:hypothetical protein